jgi:PhnB protein
MRTKPIPDGYHTVTPFLAVHNGSEAIEFYKKAFGAKEMSRFMTPDGHMVHGEIKIGDSTIMLAEEMPDHHWQSPDKLNGFSAQMYLYVEDVDAFFKKAVAAGAKEVEPIKDQFYGDRSGALEDPFGHRWWVATHVEDVPQDELQKRAQESMASHT